MIDQQAKFTAMGLKTKFVGEAQSDNAVRMRVLSGDVQLVLITPESLISNDTYRNMLQSTQYREKLVALVVDEAHCVKTWGDQFRRTFAMIGDLRSLLPTGVHIMALTATATSETFHIVSAKLSMHEPTLVAMPPDRGNISYSVRPKTCLDKFTTDIATEVRQKGSGFPKSVIFIRKYRHCSDLYALLLHKLGTHFTDPPGYPNIVKYRLIDMYSRVLTAKKKENVLTSFIEADSTLRLVIATTAFGMGIDCPNIRRIYHFGLPNNLEEYVQETGRAGRDGGDAEAILFQGSGEKHANKSMKLYASNEHECRRTLLFSKFLKFYQQDVKVTGSKCCGICAAK